MEVLALGNAEDNYRLVVMRIPLNRWLQAPVELSDKSLFDVIVGVVSLASPRILSRIILTSH